MENIRVIVAEVKKEFPDNGGVLFDAWIEGPEGLTRGNIGGRARGLRPGDCLTAAGDWHSKVFRGKEEQTFRATKMLPAMPETTAGAERFLLTAFPMARFGIPAADISELCDRPGLMARLLENPRSLISLAPPDRRQAVLDEWNSRTQGDRAASLMEAAGVDPLTTQRILLGLPHRPFDALHADPYQVGAFSKVGFANADRIGTHIGIGQNDRRRLSAAVAEVLRQEEGKGSTAANLDTLLQGSSEVGKIDPDVLLQFLVDATKRRDHDIAIYQTPAGPVAAQMRLYVAEADIVSRLARMLSKGRKNAAAAVQAGAEEMFAQKKFSRFDAVQRCAVEMAATEPLSIITGGPGTGKSTVMEVVANLCKTLDQGPLLLAAPTGKAAKRLEEATGRKAQTVHKLLKAKGGRDGAPTTFGMNADEQLPAGCMIIIDEASMLDAEITAALLNAMPPDGRLLLVGDDGQLPSVGPGSVLADLLKARIGDRIVVPSVKLIQVYRQSHDSGIATGAALVREGVTPDLTEEDRAGVSFLDRSDRQLTDEVEQIVCALPDLGLDPLRDVSVLCPQTTGPGGTWEVNTRLSRRLNAAGAPLPGVMRGKHDEPLMPIPKAGDRVMLTENDDDNDVMNGDLGILVGPGKPRNGRHTLRVEFDSGPKVEYLASDWRKLILAYAGTIHKSQGSQYHLVVMPITPAHKRMLDRQLIYTGWTRAQKKLILLGNKDALVAGIANAKEGARMTLLRSLIAALRPDMVFRAGVKDWTTAAKKAQESLPAATKPAPATPASPTIAETVTRTRARLFGVAPKPVEVAAPPPRARLFGAPRVPPAVPAPPPPPTDVPNRPVLTRRGLFGTAPKPAEQKALPLPEHTQPPLPAPRPQLRAKMFGPAAQPSLPMGNAPSPPAPQPASSAGRFGSRLRPALTTPAPMPDPLPSPQQAPPRQGRLFGHLSRPSPAQTASPASHTAEDSDALDVEISASGPRY